MKRVLFIAAAALLTATAAQATPTITATLASATTKTAVVTDHTVWKCSGTTCTTRSIPRESYTTGECRALAAQAGTVTAYAGTDASLDAESITRCNAQ